MTTILHIDSSAKKDGSTTRQLTAYAVQLLTESAPKGKVIYRDLARDPLPHINSEFLAAMFSKTPPVPYPDELRRSDSLIDEVLTSDILVIGAPMYNFNIPTTLKVWIDYICRAGKTFRYTAEGPKGLILGKRAILAVGTGGLYSSGPMTAYDHVVPYMKQILGFMGITNVSVVMAEKQGLGADLAAAEIANARSSLKKNLAEAA